MEKKFKNHRKARNQKNKQNQFEIKWPLNAFLRFPSIALHFLTTGECLVGNFRRDIILLFFFFTTFWVYIDLNQINVPYLPIKVTL